MTNREAKYKSIYDSLVTGEPLSCGINLTADDAYGSDRSQDGNNSPSNKNGSEKDEENDKEAEVTETTITSQFQQSIDTCESPIPIKISTAFNMIEEQIKLVNQSMLNDHHHTKIDWSMVFPAVFYQLTEVILLSKEFPMRCPNPDWAVNKTLENLKLTLRGDENNAANLFGELIQRAEFIRNFGEDKMKTISSTNKKLSSEDTPLLLAPKVELTSVNEKVNDKDTNDDNV